MLHHQSLAGNKTIVEILLGLGADPKLKSTDGRSAIDLAVAAGWPLIEAAHRKNSA